MIKIQIVGQTLRVVTPRIVAGTDRYLSAVCQLTPDWDNATSIFVHFKNEENVFDIELDDHYEITEDKGLNLTSGRWTIWVTAQTVVYGEIVQRITTNSVDIDVEDVLDGNDSPTDFPSIPTTIVEKAVADCIENRIRAETAAEKAESSSLHPPIIGENGHWYQWNIDISDYEDTGKPSKGSADLTPETLDTIAENVTNAVRDSLPTKLSDLESDAEHRTVTDDEKAKWNRPIDISGKVDKVDGKALSTNDYDNTAKAKVDAIPENPKYTDTVYDDTELKAVLNRKLTSPDDPIVGQTLKVRSVDEDGTVTCGWANEASGNLVLRNNGEYIQYKTDGEWLNIIPLADLKGAPGERGLDGTDYLLKPKDLNEIADLVILKLPNGNEARY